MVKNSIDNDYQYLYIVPNEYHEGAKMSGGSQSAMARFSEFLVQRGLRLTNQRRLIASVFFREDGHHSVEELCSLTRKDDPRVGYATVYRTMKLLKEAGLATGMSLGDGFARYEAPTRKGHHDHLICRACGKIVEFENDRIESLQEEVARRHGFKVTDHKMELYGVCGACLQARS
jgi:Fur family ferric uptake transcriptional regulator